MTRLETRLHILGLWRMVPWEVAEAHFTLSHAISAGAIRR